MRVECQTTISGKTPPIETEIYLRRYIAHKVKCPKLWSYHNQTYSVCSKCACWGHEFTGKFLKEL